MTPIEFEGVNIRFRKPGNWDEARFGKCVTLPVQQNDHGLHSVWQPSDEERMAIAAGGTICLTVVSENQPPVALRVIPTDAPSLAADIDPILDYAADAMWEVFRRSPVAAPIHAEFSWSDLVAIAASNADDRTAKVHDLVRVGRDEARAVVKRIWPLAGFLDQNESRQKITCSVAEELLTDPPDEDMIVAGYEAFTNGKWASCKAAYEDATRAWRAMAAVRLAQFNTQKDKAA